MKKKILLGLTAAVMAVSLGVGYRSFALRAENGFSLNLEALSEIEDGGLQCHPIDLIEGRLWYNTVVCLNDNPNHCTSPHSAMVSDGMKECLYRD